MAKINIDATAHIKLGTAKDNEIRADLLATLGKNDALLRDVKAAFNAGTMTTFSRPTTAGQGGFVTLTNTDFGAVVVKHLDADGNQVGSVVYGKTKFFSCLDDNSDD